MSSSKLSKNILSLSLAELVSKGVLFVQVAYLVRVLGADGFGKFNFAFSLIANIIIWITLGLDTLGMREIAKNKDIVSKYVNNIVTYRLSFSIFSYILLLIYSYFFIPQTDVRLIVCLAGISIFAQSFTLNWVFQGLEQLHLIAIRVILTNLLSLIGIFVLIHNINDTAMATLVVSLSALLNTLAILYYYNIKTQKFNLEFDFKFWMQIIKTSLPLGLSFMLITLFNNIGIYLLGTLIPNNFVEVGLFTAAFKIITLSLLPITILQQAFFPIFSRNHASEKSSFIVDSFSNLSFKIAFAISILIFIFSKEIILIQYGSKMLDAVKYLQMMSLSVIIMHLNITYSTPLIAWGYDKYILKSVLFGGLTNIILNLILIPFYGSVGTIIAVISAEISVMLLQMYYFKRISNTLLIKNFLHSAIIICLCLLPTYILKFEFNYLYFSITSAIFALFFITYKYKIYNFKNIH